MLMIWVSISLTRLTYREDERELIPICKQMNVMLMPYSPLAGGRLCRPTWDTDSLRSKTDVVAKKKYDTTEEQDMPVVKRVHEIAEKHITSLMPLWEQSR